MSMEKGRWKRLRAIFEKAEALPKEDRRLFLDEECGADGELRGGVEEMLQAAGRRLDHLDPPSMAEPSSLLMHVGRRIGPYRIERVVGRGGMGTVFLAERDDQHFKKRVALKLIRRGMDTDDMLRRFKNERQVLAELEHPGIARLIDGGASGDGLPYLVMEYVEGIPLDRFCDERRLSIRERVEIFRAVCEAVQYAHLHGVVHRDLKPNNVLVMPNGEPKLVDFGIAKLLGESGTVGTEDITATGLRVMTANYASPEQVESGRVTPASDVYSLGVILYDLLTGQSPYGGEVPQRSELERRIREEDPVKPSHATLEKKKDSAVARSRGTSIRRLKSELSGDLDTIVMVALRKEPERRYSSAAGLAEDLRRWLDGRPVLTRPDTASYRAAKFVRRHRKLVMSFAGIVALLTAGLFASTFFWLEARASNRRAEEARISGEWREYQAGIAAASMSLNDLDVAAARRYLERAPEHLRGWEWNHLWARSDRSLEIFEGHGGEMRSLAWHPDGLRFASTAQDGTVRIWSIDEGEKFRWEGLSPFMVDVEFDPSGKLLSAVSEHKALHVLDAITGEEIWKLEIPAARVAFDPTDDRLALGASDGTLLLLDNRTGAQLARLEGDGGYVTALSFSDDGRRVVAAAPDHVRTWKPDSGESSLLDRGRARVLAVHLDGDRVAIADWDVLARQAHVRIVDAESGDLELEWAFDLRIHDLARDATNAALLAGLADRTAVAWDATTGKEKGRYLGHFDVVGAVAPSLDGTRILTGASDWTVRLWEAQGADVVTLQRDPGWSPGLSLDPSGTFLAVGAWDTPTFAEQTGVSITDLSDRRELWRSLAELTDDRDPLDRSRANGVHLAWIDDGALLELNHDGIRLWDVEARELRSRLEDGALAGLSIDPRGGRFATGGKRTTIRDLPSLDVELELPVPAKFLVFSADGEELITVSDATDGEGGLVRVWDLRNPEEPRLVLPRPNQRVLVCALRPDGKQLATGDQGGLIRLWDATTGEAQGTLLGHTDRILALAYTPDGARLASGSEDGTVMLWDPVRNREMVTLRGHGAPVTGAIFGPEGRRLYSQDRQGVVRIWDSPAISTGPVPAD